MESRKPRHERKPSSTSIMYTDGKRSISFKPGQKLGIALDDNCGVKGVRDQSQAYWSGVKKGWKITAIGEATNKNPVDRTTIKPSLKSVLSSGKAYTIEFSIPTEMIPEKVPVPLRRKVSAEASSGGVKKLPALAESQPGGGMGLAEIAAEDTKEKEAKGLVDDIPVAARIKAKFDEVDADHNGRVSIDEFSKAAKELGLSWSQEEMAEFMDSVSDGGSGLGLKEFSSVCASALRANPHAKNYPPPMDMNVILVAALSSYKAKKKMHAQFGSEIENMRDRMKLDEVVLKEIGIKFDKMDKNGDGVVDVAEFGNGLTAMGLTLKKEELAEMISQITGGKDVLKLADFKRVLTVASKSHREATIDSLLTTTMKNLNSKSKMNATLGGIKNKTLQPSLVLALQKVAQKFKEIDYKNDGVIDVEELTPYLKALGFKWTKRQTKKFIDSIDKNGDGLIDGIEFRTALYASMCVNPAQHVDAALKYAIDHMGKGANVKTGILKGLFSLKKSKPKEKKKVESDVIDDIAQAFVKADHDGSGGLDAQEFTDLFLDLGLKYRREYIERIFNKIDVNGDRQLQFVELKHVMINAARNNMNLPTDEIMSIVVTNMLNKKPLSQELLAGDYELKAPKTDDEKKK